MLRRLTAKAEQRCPKLQNGDDVTLLPTPPLNVGAAGGGGELARDAGGGAKQRRMSGGSQIKPKL